jgi:hypothetical protein
MIDAAANTEYRFRKHLFSSGLGASYTWGTSYYLEQRIYNTVWDSYQYDYREKKESYLGLFVPLRYDLLLLHNHLALGIQGNVRKYFGLQSAQVDYGFHLSAFF